LNFYISEDKIEEGSSLVVKDFDIDLSGSVLKFSKEFSFL